MVYNKYFAKPEQSGILKSYRALTKISNFIKKIEFRPIFITTKYIKYKEVHTFSPKRHDEETVLHVSDSLKRPTIEIID